MFSSYYEEPGPPSHSQTYWNHRAGSGVDRHGALSVRRGWCQHLGMFMFLYRQILYFSVVFYASVLCLVHLTDCDANAPSHSSETT